MIVDLMRNDLGRVCAYGLGRASTALAPGRAAPRRLAPRLRRSRARCAPDVGDARPAARDVPARLGHRRAEGRRRCDVIAELEATGARGLHAARSASPARSPGLELNVAIRTFEVAGGRVWLGAGGGIVADSDPDAEATGGARQGAPARRGARRAR